MSCLDMLFPGYRERAGETLKTIEVGKGIRAHSNKQIPSHITKETSLPVHHLVVCILLEASIAIGCGIIFHIPSILCRLLRSSYPLCTKLRGEINPILPHCKLVFRKLVTLLQVVVVSTCRGTIREIRKR